MASEVVNANVDAKSQSQLVNIAVDYFAQLSCIVECMNSVLVNCWFPVLDSVQHVTRGLL